MENRKHYFSCRNHTHTHMHTTNVSTKMRLFIFVTFCYCYFCCYFIQPFFLLLTSFFYFILSEVPLISGVSFYVAISSSYLCYCVRLFSSSLACSHTHIPAPAHTNWLEDSFAIFSVTACVCAFFLDYCSVILALCSVIARTSYNCMVLKHSGTLFAQFRFFLDSYLLLRRFFPLFSLCVFMFILHTIQHAIFFFVFHISSLFFCSFMLVISEWGAIFK